MEIDEMNSFAMQFANNLLSWMERNETEEKKFKWNDVRGFYGIRLISSVHSIKFTLRWSDGAMVCACIWNSNIISCLFIHSNFSERQIPKKKKCHQVMIGSGFDCI